MHNTRKLICIIQENELCIFHKLFVYNTWKQIVYRGCVWHSHAWFNVVVLHSFTNMADAPPPHTHTLKLLPTGLPKN